MGKSELIAPAGNLEKMKYAFAFGADAVYLGWKKFSLRNMADNFDFTDLKEAVEYKDKIGKKLYLTLNIFPRNHHIGEIHDFLKLIKNLNIDGLIVSDMGVLSMCRSIVPDIPIHISTQANTINYLAANFYSRLGVKRVILARELTIDEISEIKRKSKSEIEVFVHGALCMSYSGRCSLSLYLTGRDANMGECTHSCRWKYYLMEEKREGEFLPLELDSCNNLYILNPKDLCLLFFIPNLINAGVDAFKIEGRMKGVLYVSSVVKAYRKVIDYFLQGKVDVENFFDFAKGIYKQYIMPLQNRNYTYDFAGKSVEESLREKVEKVFSDRLEKPIKFAGFLCGVNSKEGIVEIIAKNKFERGDLLYYRSPEQELGPFKIVDLLSEKNERENFAKSGEKYKVVLDNLRDIKYNTYGFFYF